MATKEIYTRIKCKCDTTANWEHNNPVLLKGEVAICNDSYGAIQLKIGDGTSDFLSLPIQCSLPMFSGAADNGKVLCIVDGNAIWSTPTYTILPISQNDYDALETPDANTLYVIEV